MIGESCCEKCGEEIKRPLPEMEAIVLVQKAYSGPQQEPIKVRRILCTRCSAELIQWMNDTKAPKKETHCSGNT